MPANPPASPGRATRLRLFSFARPHMRAFHMSWMAFFLCFFGWFGIAPLMPLVRDELGLTKTQVGNTIIASVAATIFARLIVGWFCDRHGPRRTYSWVLLAGSFPVMGIGLAQSYEALLLFRLAIGCIGASFVITQVHTTLMFAPNVVGTANATSAGWGNLGGGVTQMVMPLVAVLFVSLGVEEAASWRYAMIVPGAALFAMGLAYRRVTVDTPEGNFEERSAERRSADAAASRVAVREVLSDRRVWALFVIYGSCFGVELTINNVAALYYVDTFQLEPTTAGLVAGLFGMMNIFARSLGGWFGDRFGTRYGLNGRVMFLFGVLACQGAALILFSRMDVLWLAIGSMVVFSLFVQMAEGATFSVVPFVNQRAVGLVSGIVGAGGNAGAVAAGFLFRSEAISTSDAFLYLGLVVGSVSALALLVRFDADHVAQESAVIDAALAS